MTESSDWNKVNDEEQYPLLSPDPLGILRSTRQVLLEGEHVWINQQQIEQLAEQWIHRAQEQGSMTVAMPWYDQYHFYDGTERTINWLLLLDALNFSFWGNAGETRWSIEYEGKQLNGYWAEAAALSRAVNEGIPLWDAQYLSTISEETMATIFRGEGTIPLFAERVQNVREVGTILIERFDGQFARAIEQVEGNAIRLVQLLVENFASFRDVAIYHQKEIRFFKRAQICIADIAGSFKGKQWGAFTHLEDLTAFADYKLPQVLREHTILEYEPELARRINKQEMIPMGSEEEIEIRAATVWACELLRQEMQFHGYIQTAIEIDQLLWLAGQNSTHMRPYHRTRTLFY
jgi:Potential Queuosine, Q, salvage protein family